MTPGRARTYRGLVAAVAVIHVASGFRAAAPRVSQPRAASRRASDDGRGDDASSPEIGRQAKGFYTRPSAAIEKGGGFFVPGLEGGRVRVALGGGLAALAAGSFVLGGDAPPSAHVSEAIAFVAALAVALPYAPAPGAPAARPRPPVAKSPPFAAARAPEDAAWACSAIRAALPEVGFVALVETADGAPLFVDGGAAAPTARAPPAARVARRATAPDLFAALAGDDGAASAFVVPDGGKSGATWVLGTDDEDVLRDDDRAWVAGLLGSVGPG